MNKKVKKKSSSIATSKKIKKISPIKKVNKSKLSASKQKKNVSATPNKTKQSKAHYESSLKIWEQKYDKQKKQLTKQKALNQVLQEQLKSNDDRIKKSEQELQKLEHTLKRGKSILQKSQEKVIQIQEATQERIREEKTKLEQEIKEKEKLILQQKEQITQIQEKTQERIREEKTKLEQEIKEKEKLILQQKEQITQIQEKTQERIREEKTKLEQEIKEKGKLILQQEEQIIQIQEETQERIREEKTKLEQEIKEKGKLILQQEEQIIQIQEETQERSREEKTKLEQEIAEKGKLILQQEEQIALIQEETQERSREEKTKLEQEIAEKEKLILQQKEQITQIQEKTQERSREEKTKLEQEIKEQEKLILQQKEQITQIQEKTQELIREEKTKLEQEIKEQEKLILQQKEQIIQIQEETKEQEAIIAREKEQYEKSQEKIKNLQDTNHALQEELQEQSGRLKQTEKEFSHLKESTEQDEIFARINQLEQEQGKLKNNFRLQSIELKTARKEKNTLSNKIGEHKNKQSLLENTLSMVNRQAELEKLHLAQSVEKNKELKKTLDNKSKSLDKMQQDLTHFFHPKQKKHLLGISKAQQGIVGLNENTKLFSSLLQNIASHHTTLKEKIKHLCGEIFQDKTITRVFIYSFKDKKHLEVECVLWDEESENSLLGKSFPLKESTFGQAITTHKSQLLEATEGMKEIDVPPSLKTWITKREKREELQQAQFVFLMPLVESKEIRGLMTLASREAKTFTPTNTQLLEKVAPLFALALQQKSEARKIAELALKNRNLQQVTQYIQSQYSHLSPSLAQDEQQLENELKGNGNVKLKQKTIFPLELLPYQATSIEKQHLYFIRWMEKLGDEIRDNNLIFQQHIHPELILTLSSHLGEHFQYIYWLIWEATKNVILQSKATQISIHLTREQQCLRLAIVDDGDDLIRTGNMTRPKVKVSTSGQIMQSIATLCQAQLELTQNVKDRGLTVFTHWHGIE